VRLSTEVEEKAALLRALVPSAVDADGTALSLAALALVRVERAGAFLAQVDDLVLDGEETSLRFQLRKDLRGWMQSARRWLRELGLTPEGRAELGIELPPTEARAAMSPRDETSGPDDLAPAVGVRESEARAFVTVGEVMARRGWVEPVFRLEKEE